MALILLVPSISKRLEYTADWIFREQLGLPYSISTDTTGLIPSDQIICYGQVMPGLISIPAQGLLAATNIQQQRILTGKWNNALTLFASEASGYDLPFDLFSAVFYLISRYEEYLPYTPDKHGRYPATESILFKEGVLEIPLIDCWLHAFRKLLTEHGIRTLTPEYSYLPTYDIDIAWSYLHKGWKRNIGGYIKDTAASNLKAVQERTRVLRGHQQDPYDSFDWLEQQHKQDVVRPLYFMLCALQLSDFDKNISPLHPAMQALIRKIAAKNSVGIHPSYFADTISDRTEQEKSILQEISGTVITQSRQHYIKARLPDIYRRLIAAGITDDYSMGYATKLGFRAGTSRSFCWYDLQHETITTLRVFPFCFMDATAHYELKLSPAEAFTRLRQLKDRLYSVQGMLITIFHNFSLGTEREWLGWQEQYSLFLTEER